MQTLPDAAADLKSVLTQPTQHIYLTIPGTDFPLSVVRFRLEDEMNGSFMADIVVTSPIQGLPGADCIGRWAMLRLEDDTAATAWMTAERNALRTWHGVVTQWEHVSSSRDEATYRLRLEPRFALLRQTTDSRVFLETSLREVIKASIVDRQTFVHSDVEFEFEASAEQFEQVLMYEETVEHFISRICRKYGLYYYIKHADDAKGAYRDTLVFGDSAKGYMRALEVPLAAHAGLESVGRESIQTLRTIRTSVPETVSVWDHNYRTPEDPLAAESKIAYEDRSVAGTLRRSAEHHRTADAAQTVAELRRDEQIARQTVYKGTSNVVGMTPGMVVRLTNHTLPDAKYGFVITKLICQGGRAEPFSNEFEAMPSHLPFRPEYDPHQHWRWMPGPVKAVIESRYDDGYAHPDEHGRYFLKFGFDWRKTKPGFGSKPTRLMKPSAAYRGGFHSPKLPGTEVLVGFTGGDIDRPIILGAAHDYARTDVVYGIDGWNTRSIWRTPLRGADIRMEDYKGQEGVKVATVFAKSSVSLGYLVTHDKKRRGEGFEARTQGHAVMRGSAGVFLTADKQDDPSAPHLDMPAALMQMQSALAEASALRSMAEQAKAELAEVKAQQAQLESAFKDLQKAVILLSAPEGIGAVTPKSIHLLSGEHLAATTGKSADFSVGDSFTVAAAKAASIFAQQSGIKALAANGNVDVQAQSGAMNLTALDGMNITSANGKVVISAKEEILFVCGGSYFRIRDIGIEDGTRGDRVIRSASFQKTGPQTLSAALPVLPNSKGAYDQAFVVRWTGTTIPAANVKYQLFSEGKLISEGVTGENGETALGQSDVPQDVQIKLLGN
ncbi:Actin cross-linking toxin VgrG1 [Pandoraea terrae]|uniref:Actin cross-linking toxin VgrG1 n=1 Tax=Pandoraea terrae TaxID=1537710 RepID=A0A5E4Z7N0_9BURK|nr:type VI secretion system Vgr family protein [Pandoraea terrae]VVE56310.1 Actin cross-linking toxin VgrG1 [Pandoraea terrae]